MSFFVAGAILVAGGVSAYSSYSSAKKARKQTERESKKNEQRIADQKAEEDKKKKQTAMRMQKRRGAAKAGTRKTRDTIKTGSLGIVNASSGSGGKKILGA